MIHRIARLCFCCLIVSLLASCDEDSPEITNQPPQITEQSFSIQENSPEGTLVGTILATDPEQDALTFAIVSGNTDGAFSMHATSGKITVATPSALNSERNASFTLTVTASDGRQSSSATITIATTKSDDQLSVAPSIEDQTFLLDENSPVSTVVGTVVATSNEPNSLVFAIASGNADDVFAIDASSGEITVQSSVALDFEAAPSFTLLVEVGSGLAKSSATITITLNDIAIEPLTTQEQIDQSLSASYVDLARYLEHAYLFDAVYTNTIRSPSSDWNEVHAHTLNPLDPKVLLLWSEARTLIFGLNNLIASSENVLSSGPEQQAITGQARLMRAYLHFTMLHWFGSIPLDMGTTGEAAVQVTPQEALAHIQSDIASSMDALPAQWSNESDRLTHGAARLLSARVSVFKQDWAAALAQAEALMNSQVYTLSTAYPLTADAPEVSWGFYASGEVSFAGLYSPGSFVPVFRLTEAYLIVAEANIEMGNAPAALAALNVLRERADSEAVSEGNQDQLRTLVAEQWQQEMNREGLTFATLKRFGTASSQLFLDQYRLVLPVPQAEIDSNFNLFQNPGY